MPTETTLDISELEDAYEDLSREEAREAAGRWFSVSQERLLEGGDAHGYDVSSVAQAASPPQWDGSEGGFVFKYFHPAARYFEDGTDPHEVTPSQADALAFEWPEMRGEPFGDTGQTWDEVFADSWPTVFLPRTEVSGIEALDYFKMGRQAALRFLEGRG